MKLPFTRDEFLGVFARYNEAVWPAQFVLVALAMLAVFALIRRWPQANRIASVTLGLLWLWSGLVYHLLFFSRINRLAIAFGVLFLIQSCLWLGGGVGRSGLRFDMRVARARRTLGALIIAYSLVIYPLLGIAFGHAWPDAPTFGAPCPVVLFTFGLLVWGGASPPKVLLIVPLAWAVMGTTAAIQLTMYEDWGLLISGVIAALVLLPRRRQMRHGVHPPNALLRHPEYRA